MSLTMVTQDTSLDSDSDIEFLYTLDFAGMMHKKLR